MLSFWPNQLKYIKCYDRQDKRKKYPILENQFICKLNLKILFFWDKFTLCSSGYFSTLCNAGWHRICSPPALASWVQGLQSHLDAHSSQILLCHPSSLAALATIYHSIYHFLSDGEMAWMILGKLGFLPLEMYILKFSSPDLNSVSNSRIALVIQSQLGKKIIHHTRPPFFLVKSNLCWRTPVFSM
jgi:hypothetical protein